MQLQKSAAQRKKNLRVDTEKPSERSGTPPRGSGRVRVLTNPSSPHVATSSPIQTLDQKKHNDETLIGILRAKGPKVSFGELALLTTNNERTATIRTDMEEAEFLTIDKADFERLLKDKYTTGLQKKIDELKSFDLFDQISDIHLKKIALHVEHRTYRPSQLIVPYGARASHVYFIDNGSAVLHKKTLTSGGGSTSLISKRQSFKMPSTQYTEIGNLNKGEIFGQESLSESPQTFPVSVRAGSEGCEAFVIHRDDLVTRLKEEYLAQFRMKNSICDIATTGPLLS